MGRSFVSVFVAASMLAAALSVAPGPASADASRALQDARVVEQGHPRILCLGDSLTAGRGVPAARAWPSVLGDTLRAEKWPHAEIINAGVNGSTSSGAAERLQAQLAARPDVLILALGANDGLRNVDPAETKRNLAAAIDLAKANGIAVLLTGMKMPPIYGFGYRREFQETFESLAAEKQVTFLPFLLEGVALNDSMNLIDRVHPNAKGHTVVAKLVAGKLRPMLKPYEVEEENSPLTSRSRPPQRLR